MTKYIAVSFTLNNQSFERISSVFYELVDNLEDYYGKNLFIIHGFLPREVVELMNYPTSIVDMFDEKFPNRQINCHDFDLTKMRLDLAQYIRYFKADVYVIGDIREGVADEVANYQAMGIKVNQLPID